MMSVSVLKSINGLKLSGKEHREQGIDIIKWERMS